MEAKQTAIAYRDEKLRLKILEDRLKREIQELKEKYNPAIVRHLDLISEMEDAISQWEWDSNSKPFFHNDEGFTIQRRTTKSTIIDDEPYVIQQLKDMGEHRAIKESVKKVQLKMLLKECAIDGAYIKENVSYSLYGG